ncbi:hypothetical protein SCLCIDRAFT_1212407 [Scleroderma citrinum Foug A]|uniref:Uncharacterized protein n=1 Tax=Scleroderma citrinum Foug A TaxID=1036808 RepID=A0A0C2ZUT4_9AGAM|nr:hypothetical protein SCLCIDRAFT_1212407 [Scleroderma citrinum Foug A]
MGPHVNLDASDSVNGVMNRRTAKSGLGEIESVCNMGFQPRPVVEEDSDETFNFALTDRGRTKGSAPTSSSPDIIIIVSPSPPPTSAEMRSPTVH